jgi:TRAP-type C4-dicarboxylate transport system permease small subunit
VVSRLLHFHVPGTDAYAGYLMAGAGFLALAHTLKRASTSASRCCSAHSRAAPGALEIWALAAASALALLSAYYSGRLAWQSHAFNDISTGNDATPLWLPQLAMVAGTVVLAIAFIDELVLELQGRRVQPGHADALAHNE